ncbi:MAG: ComF family protein [Pseudomonadota bacterium]|nr:ComF family protein [Pseudomonadota bacterium]
MLAPYRYAPPVDKLVQRAKFNRDLAATRLLGNLLADAVRNSGHELPTLVIPVPLHPSRQRVRGYNQSRELARHAGRGLNIPVSPGAVVRTRDNPPQAGLTAKARRANVRGAFAVRHDTEGAHVAILDDVLTTGSTVSEIVHCLRRTGTRRIEVWTIARTV